MSSAGLGGNPAKTPHLANNDRPGGASALATSRDPDALALAIAMGNRQTRRLALKNLARLQRNPAR
jgi:hypothetical protein